MVALVCMCCGSTFNPFFVRKQDKMCYHSTTVLTVNCRVAIYYTEYSIIDLVSGALLKNIMRSFKNIIAWFKPTV